MQTDKRTQILQKYTLLYKKHKGKAGYKELRSVGVSEKDVRYHFDNIQTLNREARKEKSDHFPDLVLEDLLKIKRELFAEKELKGFKKFVITTAVAGCLVSKSFLAGLRNFCKINKAKLIILVAADPAANVEWTIDKDLADDFIVFKDIRLNSNLFLSSIKLSAKHIDPITGLTRISQRMGSTIFASPKQRLVVTPTSNKKIPSCLMGTGAITLPNYSTDKYLSERTAYLAQEDHQLAALIIEIENENYFHFRQIQADKEGSFIDLGTQYHANKTNKVLNNTLVLGDWHSQSVDPAVLKCYREIGRKINFDKIIVHDLYDGKSLNPHELNNSILRAQRAESGELSLENEIKGVAKDLDILLTLGKELVIVASNHDEFLFRYLKEGLYVKDPHNHRLCLEIACKVMDGENAVKAAIEIVTKKKVSSKIRWLKRDEDYKIAGVQLAAHGDQGSGGSKGTLKGMELAYNNCITGHTHVPQILRNAWCVGTSTYLRLSYNQGPSGWMNTCCTLYSNGSKQLINIIDNKWKL